MYSISQKNSVSKMYNVWMKIAHFSKKIGFRVSYLMDQAVLELINEMSESLNNLEYFSRIFIDLSKVIDTVDHEILLNKLYLYGIKGKNID